MNPWFRPLIGMIGRFACADRRWWQWTMFFLDPSGNALEFKAFQDLSQLFAV